MSRLQFPHRLYSGMEAFDNIFDKDYESVLIISDGNLSGKSGSLIKLKRKFDALFTRTEVIISDDSQQLFSQAKKFCDTHTPEALIAVGDGKTLDCGRAVSGLCETPLVCVIETLPCALTEYDTQDMFLYKNPADVCVIDPAFINISDSSGIAYEALGTACLALESAVCGKNRYITAVAAKAFYEIYKNIMPAYRGEISARENLVGAMYASYTAYINSFDYSWQSASFRLAEFFSKWNSERISTLAACITGLAEYLSENFSDKFSAFAKDMKLTPLEEVAPIFLTDEIRRIQATLSVPFALKNFLIDEDDFTSSCKELPEEDRDLFYRCYYGKITFIKS